MSIHSTLAYAFCYPHPQLLDKLKAGLAEVDKSPGKNELVAFVKNIDMLTRSEWEELCTRTLDLSPAAAPYVGFQVWGESYQRGEFMAKLNREMYEFDIDVEGELPDHLVPILRYLDATDKPIPELVENYENAINRMASVLRSKDKDNPYLFLFEAALKLSPKFSLEESLS